VGIRRRYQRDSRRDIGVPNERANEALTDLSAYALTLDVECHRLEDRMLELAQQDSSAAERRALVRERAEMAEELNAFRRVISALASTLAARQELTH
jgi:hypothetical protein